MKKHKKSSKKKARDTENSALRVRVALRAVRWGGAAIGALSLPITHCQSSTQRILDFCFQFILARLGAWGNDRVVVSIVHGLEARDTGNWADPMAEADAPPFPPPQSPTNERGGRREQFRCFAVSGLWYPDFAAPAAKEGIIWEENRVRNVLREFQGHS